MPPTALERPVSDTAHSGVTDVKWALLNILDDFASEQSRLRDMQTALLNILEDSSLEREHSQETQRAVLNILEDFAEEKNYLEQLKQAFLNILEDLAVEKSKLQDARMRLEQSNRELMDFTSVASHDLQEPLRKVQAFGDKLNTGCRAMLDDQGRDSLDRMLNATKRMQSLIRDLLSYAQVTSKAKPMLPVNLAQVTREVLSDLEIRIAEVSAQVEVGDLPTIEADAVQMRQLLQNLVGNALKFRKRDGQPIIRVHAETNDSGSASESLFRLIVEDNGIGFEEKYVDRIFVMFQRLHGRAEYEGTGVGLAICRKIAQRHGGDITATSFPGLGASFVVTLPVHRVDRNNDERP
jgi:light-regulated signal transduction histidine kinase (bacteriophytochrome)